MMDAPSCMLCNTRHWSKEPCPFMLESRRKGLPMSDIARRLRNEAIEREEAEIKAAVNKRPAAVTAVIERKKKKTIDKKRTKLGAMKHGDTSAPKQRWTREEYNEYQRKLMRERRAKLKAERDKRKPKPKEKAK